MEEKTTTQKERKDAPTTKKTVKRASDKSKAEGFAPLKTSEGEHEDNIGQPRCISTTGSTPFTDQRAPDEVFASEGHIEGKLNMAMAGLINARKTKRVLTGQIVAEKLIPYSNQNRPYQKEAWAAVVLYGGLVRVTIPYWEMFVEDPIDPNTVNFRDEKGTEIYLRRQHKFIASMGSLEIPFMVDRMDTKTFQENGDYSVFGTRRAAMLMIQRKHFSPDNPYRIRQFGIYEAMICSVGYHGVRVTLSGVDKSIWVRDLTYRYMEGDDLEHFYHVGMKIPVAVMNILQDSAGHISLELSGKHAEMEISKAKQGKLIHIGDITTGTISRAYIKDGTYDKRSRFVLYAWLDHFEMPIVATGIEASSVGKYPVAGEVGRFRVKEFAPNGMTIVDCMGIDGPQGIFNRR